MTEDDLVAARGGVEGEGLHAGQLVAVSLKGLGHVDLVGVCRSKASRKRRNRPLLMK